MPEDPKSNDRESAAEAYYNDFYAACARMDAAGASFRKIEKVFVKTRQGMNILDVGCGFGAVSSPLIAQGHRVSGMEVNRDALAELKRLGFETFPCDIQGDWNIDGRFDAILLLDVLEHVFDPVAVLRNAVRILAPGGYVIISVPLYFDLRDRLRILFTGNIVSYDNRCYGRELHRRFRSYNYDHIRFFQARDILEMLSLTGLRAEAIHYAPWPSFHPVSRLLVRLLSNRFTIQWSPHLFAHSMILRAVRA